MEFPFCGHRIFSMMCLPLKGETRFCIFEKPYIKQFGIATYFLFNFLRGKLNKKQKPYCDSFFSKDKSMRKKVQIQRSYYLLGRYNSES